VDSVVNSLLKRRVNFLEISSTQAISFYMEDIMPNLRIEVETVEAIAAKIKSERDGTVADLISRLRNINNELEAAWNGPAQVQFQQTYGNWITDLEHYSDTLNSINQYLVSVANNFRELDEAARAAAANAAAGH